jgi:CBS domain-containing protein
MNAADIMTHPAVTLAEDASLADAIRIMVGRNISGLPVVDRQQHLVGVLTEGDLLRRVEVGTADRHWSGMWNFLRGPGLNAEEYVRANSRRVADLMTRDPVSVTASTSLDNVVGLMERKHIKRLPVLEDDRIIGVISRADVLRAVSRVLGAPVEAGGTDTEILARLRDALEDQPWFTARNIVLSVDDGIVRIQGAVTDDRMRAALRVAAQNVSGRTDVKDEVLVIDPTTGF